MDRRLALLVIVGAAACTQPENASVQVLVGGTIEGSTEIGPPVIVIEKGAITAVGAQTHLPIPRGSAKTDTAAYRIRHANGGTISPGQTADLDLVTESGEVARRMRGGVWQ